MLTKISVIIAVYNCEEFILEAVNSVLQQMHDDHELIVADDGSTDGTLSLVRQAIQGKTNATAIQGQHSGGPGRPRNQALRLASGKYVMFLDADDFLPGGTLDYLYDTGERNNADVVVAKMENFDQGTDNRWVPKPHAAILAREGMVSLDTCPELYGNLGIGSKIFKKRLIQEHDITFLENRAYGEDQPFCVKAYVLAETIFVAGRRCYCRRITKQQATSSLTATKFCSYLSAYRTIRELLAASDGHFDNYKKHRLQYDIARFFVAMKRWPRRDRVVAMREFRKSVGRLDPRLLTTVRWKIRLKMTIAQSKWYWLL